jgi:hypothetical protein
VVLCHTISNLLSHKQNYSPANFAADDGGGFHSRNADINTNSTNEMLSDDGNLFNPSNAADPYFDSNTIQKNVTGLVGMKIDNALI